MSTVCTLLLLLLALVSATPLPAQHSDGRDVATTPLDTRQIITANPSVACCTSCTGTYDQMTYLHTFDDLCGWANNLMQLWGQQTYYTGDAYCDPGTGYCIRLAITYECDDPATGSVFYSGCMGYFGYAINPAVCPGPLYRGARIRSADGCWIFQAIGDTPVPATSLHVALECDDNGRWCRLPMTNSSLPVPDRQWEEYVQVS